MKKKQLIAIIISATALVAVLVGGAYAINKNENIDNYNKKLVLATNFLNDDDTESAIIALKQAIALDPQNEEAYFRLYQVYVNTRDYDLAELLLKQGYDVTKNEKIKYLLTDELPLEIEDLQNEVMLNSEKDYGSMSINEKIIKNISNLTYNEYIKKYNKKEINVIEKNKIIAAEFENVTEILFYENDKYNTFDTVTNIPIGDKKASYAQVSNISSLFNGYAGDVSFEQVKRLFGPDVRVINNPFSAGSCVTVEYLGCEIYIASDTSGNVKNGTVWNRIIPIRNDNQDEKIIENAGGVNGKIIDASNGMGVNDAKIFVREGYDNKNGQVIEEFSVSNQGTYSVNLSEGKYTFQIKKNGYQDEYQNISVIHGVTLNGQNITISSKLSEGEVRVVLSWGSRPFDLDLHLTGRTGNGNSVDVSFTHMVERVGGEIIASLDVDDTSSYGPETITIKNGMSGSYDIYIVDFSSGGRSDLSALTVSSAIVKIYLPGESSPRIFSVPTNGTGTIWRVCRIENGAVTTINTIGN